MLLPNIISTTELYNVIIGNILFLFIKDIACITDKCKRFAIDFTNYC